MLNTYVTLVTYTYNTETYLLVARLESEGIQVHLKNEHTLSQQQFLSNAVGGIDVQVMEKDYAKAKAILAAVQAQQKPSVPEAFQRHYEKVLVYCPTCESTNVYRKKGFMWFGGRHHVCADCNTVWKE